MSQKERRHDENVHPFQKQFHRIPPFSRITLSTSRTNSSYLLFAITIFSPFSRIASCLLYPSTYFRLIR
ncbi:MAG: hypothetical protein K2P50_06340 [Lachnospiraceae bacterium]|nr:hypothetical protein [Lachnospiraceae bacterium]